MKGFIRERRPGSYTVYWETRDAADPDTRHQHTKAGFKHKEPARRSGGQLPKGRAEGDSAREYLNSIIGAVQDGSWRPDQAVTVKTLVLTHWLPAQEARVKPTTLAQYKGAVESWVLPHLGAVKVATLTPKLVTDWQAQLRERHLSDRVVQMSTGFLRAATKYALATGLIGRDPLAGVRRPRAQAPEMKVWTLEQSRTFLSAIKDDRLFPAFALLLDKGLRRGEVAGLKWSAVDLEAGSLRVALTRVLMNGGEAVESTPKTRAGARTIDLDPALVQILRQHHARQLREKMAGRDAYKDEGWVFCDELGTAYYPGYFSDVFERRLRGLDLPKIRLHDLRHTCFSAMLAAGEHEKVVQEMAGHANITITLGTYAHVLPGMAKAAGERRSAQLFG
jgi:integrase